MNSRVARVALIAVLVFANIGCDQVTKNLAKDHLQDGRTIEFLRGTFILVYAENRGAFLSLGSRLPKPIHTVLLIILPSAVVLGLLAHLALSKTIHPVKLVTMSCIIGGGIGNLYDRIFNSGVVVDFMNFGIGNLRTGILNVADLSVTFGAIGLLIFEFTQKTPEDAEKTGTT